MHIETIGPLRVRICGGPDREGGGDGPAILLCHGFGAPGDDLVDLARVIEVDPSVRWYFPEAPLEIDFGMGITGRAWWPIDIERLQEVLMRGQRRLLAQETPPGLAEARAALEATLTELEKTHRVPRDRLLLGGFSQGAMLTTEIALHATQPFAGLAILSGTLLSEDRWRVAAAKTAPSLHVFMSHGRADPLLPFDAAEELRALLETAGARIDWAPHNGQHDIPFAAIQRLAAFSRHRLHPAGG